MQKKLERAGDQDLVGQCAACVVFDCGAVEYGRIVNAMTLIREGFDLNLEGKTERTTLLSVGLVFLFLYLADWGI